MECIRDRWADIRDKAFLLGVGGGTPESHLKFINKQSLPFPLVYDVSGMISDAYGVRKKYSFLGLKFSLIRRSTIIIDERGRIEHVLEKVKIKSHVDDVLEIIG